MILIILRHTPVWVWVLFCALAILGLSQTRARNVGRARAVLLPLVMVLLSLSGVLNTFTQIPLALVAWLVGSGLAVNFGAQTIAVRGASWSQSSQHFHIPGSWLPLMLIVSLFLTKYGVGVSLAINPALAASTRMTTLLSLIYGVYAGLFGGRAWSLLRLTRRSRAAQPAQTV